MVLLDLPSEILHTICNLCEPAKIRALRLTCHRLNEVASELLVPHVSTSFHRGGLAGVWTVAKFLQAIRRGVKSLTFYLDALQPFGDSLAEWDNLKRASFRIDAPDVSIRLEKEYPGYGPLPLMEEARQRLAEYDYLSRLPLDRCGQEDKKDLMESFRHCRFLLEDQQAMIQEDYIREFMKELFEGCPNLTTVAFSCRSGSGVRDVTIDETFQRGLYIPDGPAKESSNAMQQTLLAAHDASRDIKILFVEEMDQAQFPFDDAAGISVFSQFLSTVEKLEWHFGKQLVHGGGPHYNAAVDDPNFERAIQGQAESELIRLIEAIKPLRTLVLA